MPGKIFINYRRDDSSGTAGRLAEHLERAFGRKRLFMDVEHIPPGVDFVAYLNNQLAACEVFLAVIGPNWMEARGAGRRRLDAPNDFVATEIAAALARDIRVIPVLIDGARMPGADELPDPLKPLARRQALELRNAQFGRDAEALIEKIRAAHQGEQAIPWRWTVAAVGVVALLVAGWIALHQIGMPVWPWTSGTDSAPAPERQATTIAPGPERQTSRPSQPEPPPIRPSQPEQQAIAQGSGSGECKIVGAEQTARPPAEPLVPMAGALTEDRWWKLAGNGGCRLVGGQLELFTHQGSVLAVASNSMIRRDFIYSMRADVVSGPTQLGFGLVFGLDDAGTSYFLFAKRNERDYRLTQQLNIRQKVILPWTRSNLITDRQTPQRLQVVSEGPFITLIVDDKTLQQVRIDREPWGGVGVFVESPGLAINFSDVAFGPRN
jgi:TIR domain